MDAGVIEGAVVMRDMATKTIQGVQGSLGQLGATFGATAVAAGAAGKAIAREASGSIRVASNELEQFGRTLLMKVTLPLAGVAASATAMASQFEDAMTKVETLANVPRKQAEEMGRAVMGMSAGLGTSSAALADTLYVVASAGERGTAALEVTEMAAKAAAIGLGDAATSARVIVSAMQAYGPSALSAAQATNVMVATVEQGNLATEELAGTLGRVIGIASQVGVSFDQLGAFIATFSRLGVDAAESVTALRGFLSTIIKPSVQARQELERLGLPIERLREILATPIEEGGGLVAGMALLAESANESQSSLESLGAVIPNIRALSGFLGTAGVQGQKFAEIQKEITRAMKDGDYTNAKFVRTTETLGFAWQSLKAKMASASVYLGEAIRPAVITILNIFGKLAGLVELLAKTFNMLPAPIRMVILLLTSLVAVVGPLLLILSKLILTVRSLGMVWLALFGAQKGTELIATGSVTVFTKLSAVLLTVGAAMRTLAVATWTEGFAGFTRVVGELSVAMGGSLKNLTAMALGYKTLAAAQKSVAASSAAATAGAAIGGAGSAISKGVSTATTAATVAATAGVKELAAAWAKFTTILKKSKVGDVVEKELTKTAASAVLMTNAVQGVGQTVKDTVRPAMTALGESLRPMTLAQREAAAAAVIQGSALKALGDSLRPMTLAQREAAAAAVVQGGALRALGESLRPMTIAQREAAAATAATTVVSQGFIKSLATQAVATYTSVIARLTAAYRDLTVAKAAAAATEVAAGGTTAASTAAATATGAAVGTTMGKGFFAKGAEFIKSTVAWILGAVVTLARVFTNALVTAFRSGVVPAIRGLAVMLVAAVTSPVTTVVATVTAVLAAIAYAFAEATGTTEGWIGLLKDLWNVLKKLGSLIVSFYSAVAIGAGVAFTKFKQAFIEQLPRALAQMTGLSEEVVRKGFSKLGELWENMRWNLWNFISEARGQLQRFAEDVQDVIDALNMAAEKASGQQPKGPGVTPQYDEYGRLTERPAPFQFKDLGFELTQSGMSAAAEYEKTTLQARALQAALDKLSEAQSTYDTELERAGIPAMKAIVAWMDTYDNSAKDALEVPEIAALQISEETITRFKNAQDKAKEATKSFGDEIKSLKEKLLFSEEVASFNKMLTAMGGASNLAALSAKGLEEVRQQALTLLEAYDNLGSRAPKSLLAVIPAARQVYAETTRILETTRGETLFNQVKRDIDNVLPVIKTFDNATKEQLDRWLTGLNQAIDSNRQLGKVVPEEWTKIRAAIVAASGAVDMKDVTKSTLEAAELLESRLKAVGDVTKLSRGELDQFGQALDAVFAIAESGRITLPASLYTYREQIRKATADVDKHTEAIDRIPERWNSALDMTRKLVEAQKEAKAAAQAMVDAAALGRLPLKLQDAAKAAFNLRDGFKEVKSGAQRVAEELAALPEADRLPEVVARWNAAIPAFDKFANTIKTSMAQAWVRMVRDAGLGVDEIERILALLPPEIVILIRLLLQAPEEKIGVKEALTRGGFFDYLGKGGLTQDILAAVQGGGNVGEAIALGISSSMTNALAKVAETGKLSTFGKVLGTAGSAFEGLMTGIKVGSETGSKALGGLAGAATGAAKGFAIAGPWGAAIGGIAGLIGGLFGAGKAAKKARDAFIESAGGLAKVQEMAKYAGVSLDALMRAKSKKEVEKQVKALEEAIKKVQERVAKLTTDLGKMTQAGALMTADMAKAIKQDFDKPEVKEAFGEYLKANLERATVGLTAFLTKTKELPLTAQSAEAVGAALAGIFQVMRESGATTLEALVALKDPIAAFEERLKKAGVSGGEAFGLLQQYASLASDELAGPLFEAIDGLGIAMGGLYNLGLMNQDMFAGLASQVSAVYAKLVEEGKGGDAALQLMQPTLQKLWEMQQQFGWTVDETTQALIDQAVESGIVGEKFKSATDRMAAALDKLLGRFDLFLQALGIKIPNEAKAAADGIVDEFGRIRLPDLHVKIRYDSDGVPIPEDAEVPGMAVGGVVNRPTLATIGEAGPEVVVPLSRLELWLERLIPDDNTAATPAPAPVVLNVTINALDTKSMRDAVIDDVVPILEDVYRGNIRGARTSTRLALGVTGG